MEQHLPGTLSDSIDFLACAGFPLRSRRSAVEQHLPGTLSDSHRLSCLCRFSAEEQEVSGGAAPSRYAF